MSVFGQVMRNAFISIPRNRSYNNRFEDLLNYVYHVLKKNNKCFKMKKLKKVFKNKNANFKIFF